MSTELRVWVGCLACYNAGHLIGEWFDADEAPEDEDEFNVALQVRVIAVRHGDVPSEGQWAVDHLTEQHEELWVFDHEGFEGFLTGECSPGEAKRIAEVVERIEDERMPAFRAYCDNIGAKPGPDNMDDLVDGFEESFCGYFESEADYAMELAEDITENGDSLFSTWPASCIDWDRAWRELSYGDNWSHYIDYSVGYAIFRSI